MLIVIRKSRREVSRRAHLCPAGFKGVISSRVNRLMNQLCMLRGRLFSHREVGVGQSKQGSTKASAIRGMSKKTGDANWSKKLSVMVRFMVKRVVGFFGRLAR